MNPFVFKFCLFQFFLYDLYTNKARKREVAEANPIKEKSFSLFLSLTIRGSFLLFLVHVLSLSLSLSPNEFGGKYALLSDFLR